MRRLVLAALFGAIVPVAATAQEVVVTGTVVDAATSAPLEWVWVGADTTGTGTLTGPKGGFVLEVDAGVDSLWARRIGFGAVRVAIPPSSDALVIEMVAEGVAIEGLEARADASDVEARLRRAQSSTVITSEELASSRDQTLGGTIEQVPGVTVIQYGPSIAKPVIRGLHSQRVIVANAGVRQEGQQWGGEHAPEIDVFAAEQVEIIRGPGAVEYGSDAMGGVVRVEPAPLVRDAPFSGGIKTQLFANNRQGVVSLGLERGGIDLPLLGTVSTQFRATARRAGDATAPGFNLDNTGFGELSVSGALGWIGDRRRTELLVSRYDTRLGLFSGAHVGNFEDLQRAIERGPRETSFAYDIDNPRQQVTHNRIQLRHQSLIDADSRLDLSYAFQLNQRREFDNHGRLSTRNEPAFGLDLYTHSLEGAYGIDHGSGTLRVGVSGMRQGNISVGRGFLIPQYRLYTGGAFLRDDHEFGSVTLNAGVRWDYRWQRVFPPPDFGIQVDNTTDTWADVSGGLGVTWEFAEGWFAGSFLGRAWRAPNVNERFSQGVHHGTAQYELGDQTLTREATTSVDATLRRAGDRFSLQLNAFRNAIDGYVFLQPRAPVLSIRGAFPAFEYRQTDALMTGLELDADARIGRGVSVFAQGSAVRGDNLALDEPLYDLPADRVRLGTRWSTRRGRSSIAFEASALLVREQDQVPSETVYSLPTDAYQLVDIGLDWSGVRIGGQVVDLSLDVTNLFDRSYRDYLSRYRLFVDDPGRDVILRVDLPFGR